MVEISEDDLIQNRLTAFSMLADITKKNRNQAVLQIFLDKEKSEEYQKLLSDKAALESELEQLKIELDAAEENATAGGDEILQFTAIEDLQQKVADLENPNINPVTGEPFGKIPRLQIIIDNFEVQSPLLDFPQVNASPYNYQSVLLKGDLDLTKGSSLAEGYGFNNIAELEAAPSTPLNDIAKEAVIGTWEYLLLEAMNSLVKTSRLDSFYDFEKGTYKYEDKAETQYYRDAHFSMPVPMTPHALTLVNDSDKSSMYVEIKPTYNYYSRYYEEATVKYNIPVEEVYTPNDSIFGSGIFKLKETFLPLIYEVPLEQLEDFNEVANPAPQSKQKQWTSKFEFENFGYNLISCTNSFSDIIDKYGVTVPNSSKNFNIIIDQTDKQFLDKYDSLKINFHSTLMLNLKQEKIKNLPLCLTKLE